MGKKERERKEGDNSQKRGWYNQMHETNSMVPEGKVPGTSNLRERMMGYKDREISTDKVIKVVIYSVNQLFLMFH